jgi:predicted membrane protein
LGGFEGFGEVLCMLVLKMGTLFFLSFISFFLVLLLLLFFGTTRREDECVVFGKVLSFFFFLSYISIVYNELSF